MYYPKSPQELNYYTKCKRTHVLSRDTMTNRYYIYSNLLSLMGDNLHGLYKWLLRARGFHVDEVSKIINVTLVFQGNSFRRIHVAFLDEKGVEWCINGNRGTIEKEKGS